MEKYIFFYVVLVIEMIIGILTNSVAGFSCTFRSDFACLFGVVTALNLVLMLGVAMLVPVFKLKTWKRTIIILGTVLFIVFLPWFMIWVDSPLLPRLVK